MQFSPARIQIGTPVVLCQCSKPQICCKKSKRLCNKDISLKDSKTNMKIHCHLIPFTRRVTGSLAQFWPKSLLPHSLCYIFSLFLFFSLSKSHLKITDCGRTNIWTCICIYIYISVLKTHMKGCIGIKNKWIPEPSFRKETAWLLEFNIHPSYERVFFHYLDLEIIFSLLAFPSKYSSWNFLKIIL